MERSEACGREGASLAVRTNIARMHKSCKEDMVGASACPGCEAVLLGSFR